MAIFKMIQEPAVNTISKFNRSSYSGLLGPGARMKLPRNRFRYNTILITNTGRAPLQIYRALSISDSIPVKSVVFYPGEIKKILAKELEKTTKESTIIHNPDSHLEGGFAMSYI